MPVLFWVVVSVAALTAAGYAMLYISVDILNYDAAQMPDRSEKAPVIVWRIIEFVLSLTVIFPLILLVLVIWFCPVGRSRFYKYGRLYTSRNAKKAFRLIRIREAHEKLRTPVTI